MPMIAHGDTGPQSRRLSSVKAVFMEDVTFARSSRRGNEM